MIGSGTVSCRRLVDPLSPQAIEEVGVTKPELVRLVNQSSRERRLCSYGLARIGRNSARLALPERSIAPRTSRQPPGRPRWPALPLRVDAGAGSATSCPLPRPGSRSVATGRSRADGLTRARSAGSGRPGQWSRFDPTARTGKGFAAAGAVITPSSPGRAAAALPERLNDRANGDTNTAGLREHEHRHRPPPR